MGPCASYPRANLGFTAHYVLGLFLDDPRYFFQAFLLWFYDAWIWQLRGGAESPMCH